MIKHFAEQDIGYPCEHARKERRGKKP